MSAANSKDCDTSRPCCHCEREVALANVVLHEVHCMRHIVLCPQCKEPVPKTQIEEHIALEHSKVQCEQCEKEFGRNELEDHTVNSCEQRLVMCQYCEIELHMSKMQEHEDACGSRTEKCTTCLLYVMIKYLAEHKRSDCKPLQEEQDWVSEEESPNIDCANEYDDYDDMLPCEFCGKPCPFDILIQHQSGCGRNAVGDNAFSFIHQPLQYGPQNDKDVPGDELHYAVCELEDLAINPNSEEPENVKGDNILLPKDQANGSPVNQNRVADPASNVQSLASTIEKNKTNKSISSGDNLDAESAQNETSATKENDTSFDVIPCEFCDALITLTLLMDHQKTCRWVHPNMAFMQNRFAFNGEHEYDFGESSSHYGYSQRSRDIVATSRGSPTGNAKWTSERNNHAPNWNKQAFTEKRTHSEAQHGAGSSTSGTLTNHPRSQGPFGVQNYCQETRQTDANGGQSGRYQGRADYLGSRWQHKEQDSVRPLTKFDEDNQRQQMQREDQGPMGRQHEDDPRRQQEQPDKPSLMGQERTRTPLEKPNIHRSEGEQGKASVRLEGQGDTEEQNNDYKYRSQPGWRRGGVWQQWPRRAQGGDKESSQSAPVQPEEQNWRRNRLTDGRGQTRFPRGRARPTKTRSVREEQETETSGEPMTVSTERRLGQKPARNQHNVWYEEGQEMRLREADDQGHMRTGKRGRGRGRHHLGQERGNRTDDQAGVDYYEVAMQKRQYQERAGERPIKMNRGHKPHYSAREDLEYNGRRPRRAYLESLEGSLRERQAGKGPEFTGQRIKDGDEL